MIISKSLRIFPVISDPVKLMSVIHHAINDIVFINSLFPAFLIPYHRI